MYICRLIERIVLNISTIVFKIVVVNLERFFWIKNKDNKQQLTTLTTSFIYSIRLV
jgi:hypothetical protein